MDILFQFTIAFALALLIWCIIFATIVCLEKRDVIDTEEDDCGKNDTNEDYDTVDDCGKNDTCVLDNDTFDKFIEACEDYENDTGSQL